MPNLFFFCHTIFIAICIFFLHKKLISKPLGFFFVGGLLLKISLGIGLVYLFQYKYGSFADSESIFKASAALANQFYENPQTYLKFCLGLNSMPLHYKPLFADWTTQTVFMYKLTSWVCLFTQNNFWLVNIYLSGVSYFGLWLCANRLVEIFPTTKYAALIAFLLFPSVVLWSSGILKESFLWFFVGIIITLTLQISQRTVVKYLQYAIICILLYALLQLKYYYFVVLAPCVFVYMIGTKLMQNPNRQHYIQKTLVFLGLFCILLVVVISYFHDNLRLNYFFEGLAMNYYFLVNHSDIDSLVYYHFTEPYFISTLQNIPQALYHVWFTPMLWQTDKNILKFFAAMENSVLLLLVAANIFFWLKKKWLSLANSQSSSNYFVAHKNIQNETLLFYLLLFCCFFYVFVLAIFIALATPNLGSLIRYKVGFLPFVVFLLLSNLRTIESFILPKKVAI
jgi:hypothetical protein